MKFQENNCLWQMSDKFAHQIILSAVLCPLAFMDHLSQLRFENSETRRIYLKMYTSVHIYCLSSLALLLFSLSGHTFPECLKHT